MEEKGAPDAGDRPFSRWLDTKVHALTDVLGRPYALMVTAGNVSDVKAGSALLKRAGRMRYLLDDKGCDANSLRKPLRENGTCPGIPASCRLSPQSRWHRLGASLRESL